MISVLCASRKSIYHTIPNIDVYDVDRDARTFFGSGPIIAHPPCRSWSLKLRHQAKPVEGERDLGLWCCEVLKRNGGVLEQPAGSLLFSVGGLPIPGTLAADLFSIQVNQFWWGYRSRKSTWLCFSKIGKNEIDIPFRLEPKQSNNKIFNRMSKNQRSMTVRCFAEWLIEIARKVRHADLSRSE